MKRSIVFVPALVLFLAAPIAQAQGSNATIAEALFREAVELFKAGNVAAACVKLDESFKLDPATATLFSLAKCREREGKVASAWTHFSELVGRAQREGQKDKEAQMQAKVAELSARLPRVTLKLADHPEVTTVTVDGYPVGRAAWSVALPLDPGEHTFHFSGTNKHDLERKVMLKERDAVTLEIPSLHDRSETPSTTPPPNQPKPEEPIEPPRERGHKTLGYILGGVGVAGFAAGTIFGILAIGKKSDADDRFAARDASFKSLDDSASTSALISTVAFGVGIAGLAAGAYFVLTAPSKSALSRVERGALLW